MAKIILDRVWFTLGSDTSQSLACLRTDGQDFGDDIEGEVRSYAGGRERFISTSTRKKSVGVAVVVKPAGYVVLESWAGQRVLYRDEFGTKMWGIYRGAPWKPRLAFGTDWREVSLTFQRVTYSEVV